MEKYEVAKILRKALIENEEGKRELGYADEAISNATDRIERLVKEMERE